MTKTISIGDFLTTKEFHHAIALGDPHDIKTEIILPNIERINKALGQENDPMYLAYAVHYAITSNKYKE